MKLHILSDLHVEQCPYKPVPVDAGVVVLAGDIHHGPKAARWARSAFPVQEIVLVAGNHEFYRGDWDDTLERLRDDARNTGIHFLENDAVVIGGVRFLGATLWTDFDLFGPELREAAMEGSKHYLVDFWCIRADDPAAVVGIPAGPLQAWLVSPAAMRRRHLESRAWLAARLAEPHPGPTVVVTHHLPSMRSVAPRFADMFGCAGFASRVDDLFGRCGLWIHGHTHDGFDYVAGGTRVICNPRGYARWGVDDAENRRFDPGLVVEV